MMTSVTSNDVSDVKVRVITSNEAVVVLVYIVSNDLM